MKGFYYDITHNYLHLTHIRLINNTNLENKHIKIVKAQKNTYGEQCTFWIHTISFIFQLTFEANVSLLIIWSFLNLHIFN